MSLARVCDLMGIIYPCWASVSSLRDLHLCITYIPCWGCWENVPKVLQLWFGEGIGDPLQYFCLENPMDGEAWWAAAHGVAKSQTWLSDFTFTFHFLALEKEMATHSRVLAWRIPGTGKPGRMPSMGSHRVGHDWSDLAAAAMSSYVTDFFHPCYLYVLFSEVPLKVSAAAIAKSLHSCPTLCNSRDGSPPGFPHLWDSPGNNTGVALKVWLPAYF